MILSNLTLPFFGFWVNSHLGLLKYAKCYQFADGEREIHKSYFFSSAKGFGVAGTERIRKKKQNHKNIRKKKEKKMMKISKWKTDKLNHNFHYFSSL